MYQRNDGLWVIDREEFTKRRFVYKAGQHVLFAGPSQNGKTSLAFDLLEHTATPQLPAYVVVSKPTDPVSEKRGKELGYRRVSDWPPKTNFKEIRDGKPPGYLLWPKFGNMETDVPNARDITYRFLAQTYADGARKKKAIIVLDDTYLKAKVLGLDREMTTIHAMAGAMGIGAWTFVQKATGAGETTLMAYGAAEHVFLFYEPDKKYRERYGEIGGVDPKLVERTVLSLTKYQCLYIKRDGRFMCIVDKD
jgi:hypothetical protein